MIESCLFQLMLSIPYVQDFSLTVYYVPHKHSVVSSPLLLWSAFTIIPAPHQLMASSMTQPSHYYSTQHMHVPIYRDHLQWSVRRTRLAFSPHHYQLNTMWSILFCGPPWPNGAYSRTFSAACIAACPSTGWKLSGQLAWWHEGNLCKAVDVAAGLGMKYSSNR